MIRQSTTTLSSKCNQREFNAADGVDVVDHHISAANEAISSTWQTCTNMTAATAISQLYLCNNGGWDCLTIGDILRSFNAGVSEDQAWALIYQSVRFYKDLLVRQCDAAVNHNRISSGIRSAETVDNLNLHRDGSVHVSFRSNDVVKLTWSPHSILYNLGVIVYQALDYNISHDNERIVSTDLEAVIQTMTKVVDNSSDVECFGTQELDDVLAMCIRYVAPAPCDEHCKAVCRALVTEALELRIFLQTISGSQSNATLMDADITTPRHELQTLAFSDWARYWIQVVDELRHGVRLRKCQYERPSCVCELTPYEALMADIRTQRYQLRKVTAHGHIPIRVESDAHAIILEFIRSRPPLKKVSERVLAPQRVQIPTIREQLMDSIRRGRVLKHIQPKLKTKMFAVPAATAEPKFFQNIVNTRTQLPNKQRLIRVDPAVFDDDSLCQFNETTHCAMTSNYQTPKSRYQQYNDSENCIKLSIVELMHIRSVMAKVAVDNLSVSAQERELIENRRLCSLCVRTRMPRVALFERSVQCQLCQRTVCTKCCSKVRLIANQLRNVPIRLLESTAIKQIYTQNNNNSKPFKTDDIEHGRTATKKVCLECRLYVQDILRSSRPAVRHHTARRLTSEL